ncbi:hypothetical protein PM082_014784 [Marasmius tenuissimus]|nr:hypothetical protein PM082_014784 [Marasmius tenuissimus]
MIFGTSNAATFADSEISASGRDARKVFEEEFQNLSRQLFSEVAQVYAIDKGTIPSMVFWHGLVPLVQVLSNVGYLGQTYLERLHRQWKCTYAEMWMDPARGVKMIRRVLHLSVLEEVDKDQSSGSSAICTDPGTSITSADSEGPSDTQDLVSHSGQLHLRDSDFITHSHHAVAHKRQENHVRMETLNRADQACRQRSDTTYSRKPTSNTQALSPVTPHLVRDLLSSRSFTPVSFISRGLNTSCPPRSSVGVLSSSLSDNTTTGVLQLSIPANRPPTSQRNQRRLDGTNEVAASITLAQQEDDKANRSL